MKKKSLLLTLGMFIVAFSLFSQGKVPVQESEKSISYQNNHLKSVVTVPDSLINCIVADSAVCVGDVVNYSVNDNPNVNYFWNVTGGDGPASTTNSFTVIWGNAGSGVVSLVVKDALGNTIKTCSWNVIIHPLPDPMIISSFSPSCPRKDIDSTGQQIESECFVACDSSTVVYSTALNTNSTYQWSVSGDISHSVSGNTVTVQWGAVGMGSVSVIEESEFGCIAETTVCVEIIESPNALFDSPNASGGVIEVCLESANLSLPVTFIDQSTGSFDSPITSWFWDFGDGTTASYTYPDQNMNPVEHQFPGPGTYDIWLFVENECHCRDSTMMQVIVSDLLGPDISCAATVCADDTQTYSTSANCSIYNWVATGGVINELPPYGSSVSVTWDDTTAGTLSLSVDDCDSTYCSTPTTIYIPIIPSVTNVIGPNIVCAYSSSTYSLPSLPGCVFQWSVTGGGTILGADDGSQVVINWGATGGTVQVTYDNPELDCSGVAELDVEVKPTYFIAGLEDVCLNQSETYTAYPSTGLFKWTVVNENGDTIQSSMGNTNTLTVNWTTSGNYQVVATDNLSAYCNSPLTIPVTVHPPPPPPTYINGPDSICAGMSYTYTSTPTSPDYYLEWAVTGGTPTSGTGTNINVTWGATPPYSIDLLQTGVNSPNCSSTPFSMPVYPKSLSGAAINGLLTTCANVIASYTASPLDADDYQWSISPATMGSVLTGQGTPNIDVQWNNTIGSATLSLTATTCNGSVTVTEIITLVPPPLPVIISDNYACEGDSLYFSTITPGASYEWDFGDGNSITTTSISTPVFNDYSAPGNYLVTLTITDPGGCIGESSSAKNIVIKEAPEANLTTPDQTTYCTGNSMPISTEMFINSQPGNIFEWYGPGGIVAGNVTSYTATIPGTYYVIVTSSNGCQTTSNSISISEQPCPPCNSPGTIDFTSIGPACNTVDFTGNISGGTFVNWDFGDGSGATTGLNTTHTYSSAGYYNVSLWGLFPCPKSASKTIIIPAVANFEWEIVDCTSTGFLYDFIDLTDVVAPYTIDNWSWSFGGGTPSTSAAQNPTGIQLSPGLNTVILTVNSSGGTTCTVEYIIDVPALPVADFTAENTVCDGNVVLFTDNSTGTLSNWLWDFGDGASSQLQPTTERTYGGPGTYNASLTVTDLYGCANTSTQSIVVIPNNLSANITAVGSTTFCEGDSVELVANASGGSMPYTYFWSNLDSTSSIYVSQSGSYTVTVTNADGCQATSDPIAVTVNDSPDAIIVGESDYCVGEYTMLSANQGPSNTYQWFIDDSPYPANETLVYYLNSSSVPSIDVYVVVTAPNGCSDTSNVSTIFVHPNPLPPTINAVGDMCSGSPVTLTASNTQGLTQYLWNTGQSDPAITVSSAGNYSVTVFNEFGCSTESLPEVITPMPSFNNLMTGCHTLCDSLDYLWIGPVGSGYTYQWLLDGDEISGATSANYLIPAGASGTYQLVIDNSGCIDTSDVIDIVFDPCLTSCEGPAYIKNVTCDEVDVNGNQTYMLDIGITNPFGSPATFSMTTLPSGIGTVSSTTTTLASGYNSFSALFTELVAGTGSICIQVVITSSADEQCTIEICAELPDCGNGYQDCDGPASIKTVTCDEIDANGNQTYLLDIGITNPFGSMATFTMTTLPSGIGTVSSTTTTLTSGYNALSALFTELTPGAGTLCIQVIITSSADEQCIVEICAELPECQNGCGDCQVHNLVINGDFSSGTLSSPSFSALPPDNTCDVQEYWIGAEPRDKCTNSLWIDNLWDHTFGTAAGNFMIVDGPNTGFPVTIWGQNNISVTSGETYLFSFWAIREISDNANNNSTQSFDLIVNGSVVTNVSTDNSASDQWTEYCAEWVSDYTGPITIQIVQTAASGYNDYGIDDISFGSCEAEVPPCAIKPSFSYDFADPCTIEFVDASYVPAGVNITGYSWNFGDGSNSSGSPVSHSFSGPGTYTVCLTIYAENGIVSCFAEFCQEITIKGCEPGPCGVKPNFSFQQDEEDLCTFQFTDLSAAAMGYSITDWQWNFGDGSPVVNGLQNPQHTFSTNGTYEVCLTAIASNNFVACKAEICFEVNVEGCITVAGTDLEKYETLKTWPNPSNGTYQLDINVADFKSENIRVYNAMGEQIPFTSGVREGWPYIELKSNKPGVYYLKVLKGRKLAESMLIKF